MFSGAQELRIYDPWVQRVRCDVVEVGTDVASQFLARREWPRKSFVDGGANSAENMIEHGIIKRFFVFEIVIEQGLVHAGRPSDGISARPGNAFLRKFAHRRLQDRRPA